MQADDTTHFAAHFGVSYAINTMCYGLFRKGAKWDRFDSLLWCGVATLAVGMAYKMAETTADGQLPKNTGTAMFRNALGVGASAVTVLVFDF